MAPYSNHPIPTPRKESDVASSSNRIKTTPRPNCFLYQGEHVPQFSLTDFAAIEMYRSKQSHKNLLKYAAIYKQLITKIIHKWQSHSVKINIKISLLKTYFCRLNKKLQLESICKE